MADLINVQYASLAGGVAGLTQARAAFENEMQDVQNAFNTMQWSGQSREAAMAHNQRLNASREKLNETLNLLARAINDHSETVQSTDLRNAAAIGGGN